MAAITISRQLGSLGSQVAGAVAERLGCRLVCRELIDQAGQRAGAPEIALATIDELGLFQMRLSSRACRAYCLAMRQVAEELAAEGNVVIVGRACQVILRHHPGVLHVRLIAPALLRAERVAQRRDISLPAAQAQVEASDRARRQYLKRFYGSDWHDPELYDLIINTGRVSPAAATELICQAARAGIDADTSQE